MAERETEAERSCSPVTLVFIEDPVEINCAGRPETGGRSVRAPGVSQGPSSSNTTQGTRNLKAEI